MLDSAAWARTGTTGPTVGEALTMLDINLEELIKIEYKERYKYTKG